MVCGGAAQFTVLRIHQPSENCRISGVTWGMGDLLLQFLTFIDTTTYSPQHSQVCLLNDPILQFYGIINVSCQLSFLLAGNLRRAAYHSLRWKQSKFLTRSNSSHEKHRANLARFHVTICGCGFGPVQGPFPKFRLEFALHEELYIKAPHFSSSKPSNNPSISPQNKPTTSITYL